MDFNEPIEVTPLLQAHQTSQEADSRRPSRPWQWMRVVALCITICIISDIAEYLFLAPKVRLFESITCKKYYEIYDPSRIGPDGNISEGFCKLDPIQDELTTILGWQFFFDAIPGILLPIPYGWLADKYGRKWVAVAALLSFAISYAWIFFTAQVLQLPLQYTWISSALFVLGGGPVIGTTMITTIVADVVPAEFRSAAFLYRFASELIAEFLIPPITALLMAKRVWLPLVIAMGFAFLAVFIAVALPETLPSSSQSSSLEGHIDSVPSRTRLIGEQDEECSSIKSQSGVSIGTKRLQGAEGFLSLVLRDKAVFALLLTFIASKVGRESTNLLLQYVSKRYGWTLSKAGLLFSLRASVNILLYLVILPVVTTYVLSRIVSSVVKDLLVARVSIVLMVLGTFTLSVSSTPALMCIGVIVYTLGTGFTPIVRSLITALAEAHDASSTSDVGRLYAAIAVMEGLGSLIAGPGLAYAFRIGMKLGTNWLGMPFLVASALFALSGVVVFMVRLT